MAIEEHVTETTIQEVFNGDPVTLDIKSLSVTDQAGLICLVGLELEEHPNKSNKFISFLQNEFDPIMAVYGYYWSVDKGMLKLSPRNFQTSLLFEQEFGHLIKHLTPERKQSLFSSVQDGVNLSKVELELVSPFNIQPEDEIGTGTWEWVEPEPVDDTTQPVATQPVTNGNTIKIPFKDILDNASKKVLGVGVKKTEDRDAYHVFTPYIYQFTPDDKSDLTISVASRQYWDEHDEIDDKPISEYLEHFIPTWATNWTEVMPSVFQYTGGSTKADAIAYLNATGFFKEHQMFDNDLSSAELLMAHLEDQPKEVIAKFLNAALEYLDEDVIDTLIERYEDGWHEYTSK